MTEHVARSYWAAFSGKDIAALRRLFVTNVEVDDVLVGSAAGIDGVLARYGTFFCGPLSTSLVRAHCFSGGAMYEYTASYQQRSIHAVAVFDATDDGIQSVRGYTKRTQDRVAQRSGRVPLLTHVHKPWGSERLLEQTAEYALKDIHLLAESRSSLQAHRVKAETSYVLNGRLALETPSGKEHLRIEEFGPGETYRIRPGTLHRVTALTDVRLLEVSTPELDDVVRYEDDYGRC